MSKAMFSQRKPRKIDRQKRAVPPNIQFTLIKCTHDIYIHIYTDYRDTTLFQAGALVPRFVALIGESRPVL